MSRHATKRPAHRSPRHVKRHPPTHRDTRRVTLCLWSVNGDPVARFDAWCARGVIPASCMIAGVRYDKVERQQDGARIVHYQTRTILPREAAA